MATQENDDFEFDEDGILREKGSDGGETGILVDEDGIWRDDIESHYTYRTDLDSGLGTNERNSSSTLNKIADEAIGLDARLHHDFGQGDSFPLDEKSLNISELEASESVAGDYSFDSNEDVDLPELNDESYANTDASNFDLLEGTGVSELDAKDHHYQRANQYMQDDDMYDDYDNQDYHDKSLYDDDENLNMRVKEDRGDSSKMQNAAGSIGYLLSSHKDRREYEGEVGSPMHEKYLQRIGPEARDLFAEQKLGDSIFTQDEPQEQDPLSGRQQSLLEFEHLEKAIQGTAGQSGEQLDLIGAYLQGLVEQEEEADAEDEAGTRSPEEQVNFNESNHNRSPHKGRGDVPTSKSYDSMGTSIPFELEDSLLTNQQLILPDSLDFGSLDMPGKDGNNTGPNYTSSRPETPKGSKIPMLHDRTPSMSRPGSRGPGSRPQSRQGSPSPVRGKPAYRQGSPSPVRGKPAYRQGSPSPVRGRTAYRQGSPSPVRGRPPMSPAYNSAKQNRYFSDSPTQNVKHSSKRNGSMAHQTEDMNKAASMLLIENDLEVESLSKAAEATDMDGSSTYRSASADPVRASRKDSVPRPATIAQGTFKMRAKNRRPGSRSPMKAMHEEARLSSNSDHLGATGDQAGLPMGERFQEEQESKTEREENLKLLQVEYNTLLKKYAQAENVIDTLRVGAKVNLYGDGPNQGQNQSGPASGQMGHGVPASHQSSVGVGSSSPLTLLRGSRPPSTTSHVSGIEQKLQGLKDDISKAPPSVKSEAIKISLLTKAKGVEEQTNAFQILLDEDHLTLEDQDRALENIKKGYEKLQQDYRDSKEEHEFMRRQGMLNGADSEGFDASKEMEGELYKLNMKLDDLEHTVLENRKSKPSQRKPFKGTPVKADHSIDTSGMGSGPNDYSRSRSKGRRRTSSVTSGMSMTSEGVSTQRPSSVGSYGFDGDMGEKVERLNIDYDNLMERYNRLKQMAGTPKRDREIDNLFSNLRNIYEECPADQKPILPPELENQIVTTDGRFAKPAEFDRWSGDRQAEPNSAIIPHGAVYSREQRQQRKKSSRSHEDRPSSSMKESDFSVSSERGYDRRRHSDARSSITSSSSRPRSSRRRLPGQGRESDTGSSRSMTDSSRRSDKTDSSVARHMRRQPGNGDKDSGYTGSDHNKKAAKRMEQRERLNALSAQYRKSGSKASPRNSKPSPRSSKGRVQESEEEDTLSSDSDASTVEHNPRKRSTTKTSKTTSGSLGNVNSPKSRHTAHSDKARSNSNPGLYATNLTRTDLPTESEMSYPSMHTGKSSVKSELVKSLQQDVETLKQQLNGASQIQAPANTYIHGQQPLQHVPMYQNQPAGTNQYYMQSVPPEEQTYQYGYAPEQHPQNEGMQYAYAQEAKENINPAHPLQYSRGVSQQAYAPPFEEYREDNRERFEYSRSSPRYDQYGRVGPDVRFENTGRRHSSHVDRPNTDYTDGLGERENYRESKRHSRDHRRKSRRQYDTDLHGGYESDEGIEDHARYRDMKDYYLPSRARSASRDRGGPRYQNEPLGGGDAEYDYTHVKSAYVEDYHHPRDYRDTHNMNNNRSQSMGNLNHMGQPHTGGYRPVPDSTYIPTTGYSDRGGVGTRAIAQACPLCGISAAHSHTNYSQQPVPQDTYVPMNNHNVTMQPPGQATTAYSTPYVVPGGTSVYTPSPQGTTANSQAFVPVQMIPMQQQTPLSTSNGKVRYYVREYGGETEENYRMEKTPNRSHSASRKSRRSRVVEQHSASESEDEMNESLNSALKTAKALKKMSSKMKSTLKQELTRSYKDPPANEF